MKKIIRNVVAILMLLVECIGMAGVCAQNVKAAGAYRPMFNHGGNNDIRYIVLLLDVESGFSMLKNSKEIYKVSTPLEEVKQAANKFVSQIDDAYGENHVAIVAYGENSVVISDFTDDMSELSDKIDSIGQINGFADINEGMKKADELLSKVESEIGTKNIVHFTQGVNGVGNEYFTEGQYSSEDCSWYNVATKIKFYEYANATYKTFENIKNKYNIYSIGLFQQFDKVPEDGKEVLEFAKQFTEDIQNCGYTEVEDVEGLMFAFGKVADELTIEPTEFYFKGTNGTQDVKANCFYSDMYFMEPSTTYNEHLATMSICLEATTWGTRDKGAIYTTKADEPNAKFKNSRRLLVDELGFEEFAVNSFWGSEPTTDSIGAVAANKELDDGTTLIALAIRGCDYKAEWASNFTVGVDGQHDGFSLAKDNVIDFLEQYIKEYNIIGEVKLWIVGYSRAGAVANLTAAELGYNKDCLNKSADMIEYEIEDIYAYTFEAPQGAEQWHTELEDYSYIHNIRGVNDIIPLVAPQAWGFTRYGEETLLPSELYMGDYFADMKKEMEVFLNQIIEQEQVGKSGKINYNVPQKVMVDEFKIDLSKILFSGENPVYYEEKEMYTAEVLDKTINVLAKDLLKNRENYYYHYQEILRYYFALKYNAQLYGDDYSLEIFWEQLIERMTAERVWKIISPLYMPNLDIYEVRQAKMMENIEEYVQEVFDDSDLVNSAFTYAELLPTIKELFGNVFIFLTKDVGLNRMDKTEALIGFMSLLIQGTATNSHCPEYVMSWMMYMDSYYNGTEKIEVGRSYRLIHINCPVDVNVYSENSGKLVASIIDNQSQKIEDSYIVAYVNTDGEKIIILPADTDYKVSIEATDEGKFSYTIDEYSYDKQGNTRIINYYDISISTGDIFTSLLPAMGENELFAENLFGSTVDYSLKDKNGTRIIPDNEIRGIEALEANYNVSVTSANEYGYVFGGGEYSVGSFAQIEATPICGGEFLGWYCNDILVSEADSYRFAVKEDVEIEARFTEVELFELNIETTEGGLINNTTLVIPKGIQVDLDVETIEGYEFVCWTTSNNGEFENENELNTVYTMGSGDTTIMAVFRKIENEEIVQTDIINNIPEVIPQDKLITDENVTDLNLGYDNTKITYMFGVLSIAIVCMGMSIKLIKKR